MNIGDRVVLVRAGWSVYRGTVTGFMDPVYGVLENRFARGAFATVDWDDPALAMVVETRVLDVIQ
jgi:hypothetical protein